VSTSKTEEVIDLQAVNAELVEIEKRIAEAAERHNGFLRELGLREV
jgi:type I restriction enzyme M protein